MDKLKQWWGKQRVLPVALGVVVGLLFYNLVLPRLIYWVYVAWWLLTFSRAEVLTYVV